MTATSRLSVALRTDAYGALDRALRAIVLRRLGGLRGTLVVEEPFGTVTLGQRSTRRPVVVRVHDPAVYRALALRGTVGGAEAYVDGVWDCDDLVGLVRLLVHNRDLLDRLETGLARVAGWAMRLGASIPGGASRRASRENVRAHYDLGNDLFRLFLGEDMMYSSAIFARADEPLEQASQRKLARICEKLDLRPGDRVLEIGGGWGTLSAHMARLGCAVTMTTISDEQYAFALERVSGLDVTLLRQDYRDLRGRYDKLVAVEMIEAVGPNNLETFLRCAAGLLAPHGLALIQAITIEDHRYEQALRSVDFIRRHVFPGSFIPCVSAIVGAAARATDLRLIHLEDIGESYALTLRAWRERFLARADEVRALGYPERFLRHWELYLCYCEGGFLERSISDAQLLFARPENRRAQIVR